MNDWVGGFYESGYSRTPDYPAKPEGQLETAVSVETMKAIADAYTNVPEGFTVHPAPSPA